ncbi:hypothetical protein GE21DRAFT_5456 [Neurospora crassa]|uniref:DUF7053 domain-containing protein n=1 Tax=Neurospora crassa (strain ATCC 24698 / 74-OR23-1A / CBS 708.71 / DSM 1257 / FGSC 987) TaxID=367110 RepID=Q7S933_NEUCR|nr:hypothetical protein NCU07951 [Neurospora crassa OR74A]EAA32848.1 hypothetical protein NCU07951 [Neurospora crassa OR74A]KHE85912.1 hypothetical protein GE21DRAFT_5456 [Neurospora crassa]|eukprot:XP_962084.1 hypothetical protein NCU07951 [Neurospora crassa OR74A]
MSHAHPLKIITRIPLPPPTPPSALLSALHAYVPLITANPYLKSYISLPLPLPTSSSSSYPAPPPSSSNSPHPLPPSLTDDPSFFHPPGPDGFNPQSFLITDSVPLLPLPDWLGGGSLLGSKEVSVPCTFQSFGYGVRCKAVAPAAGAGSVVVVRSSYEVRHRYRAKGRQPQEQERGWEQKGNGGNEEGQGQGQQEGEQGLGLGLGQGLRAGLRKGGSDDNVVGGNKSKQPTADDNNNNNNNNNNNKKLINKVTGTSIDNYEYELVEIATIECPAIVRPFVKAKFEKGHHEVLQTVVDQVVAKWMQELRSSKGSGAASGAGRGRTLLQEIQQT